MKKTHASIPGDVPVLRIDRDLTPDQIAALRAAFEMRCQLSHLQPGHAFREERAVSHSEVRAMNHTSTPHDAMLAAAITAAADTLRFDHEPGTMHRAVTLGLFVARLADRIAFAFPDATAKLRAVIERPARQGGPASAHLQQQQQQP